MSAETLIKTLEEQLAGIAPSAKESKVGIVTAVKDGIATVAGLPTCKSTEMVEFETGGVGVALNLETDSVGIMILSGAEAVSEGTRVTPTGNLLSVNVSKDVIGRVVNALVEPIDGKGPIGKDEMMPVEKVAPGVMTRQPVDTPLQTGIMAIDSLVPIGRGQRELIIGDRQTGKTTVALDTIINQKGQGVKCVYVAIGQKQSRIMRAMQTLENAGAMAYTTIVAASASENPAMLFIAPYAGTAIAEYFLNQGEDVLVVYDDLSKHAVAYREVSLLLRRPPGREAYPGDVFYLHSRLLERSCRLNKENGGGSITSLPIIETKGGDVSAYIPTNVISITDGQIYLDANLFNKGIRPAMSPGSVSRVGGAAQIKSMKKTAGKLKLQLAQYRELESFAQFGSDLDPATQKTIERGKRMTELLKQPQYQPIPVELQVASIFAGNKGYIDNLELSEVKPFEAGLHTFLKESHSDILTEIKKGWKDETVEALNQAIADYKSSVSE